MQLIPKQKELCWKLLTFHGTICQFFLQDFERFGSNSVDQISSHCWWGFYLPPQSRGPWPFQDLGPFTICASTRHQSYLLVSWQFSSNSSPICQNKGQSLFNMVNPKAITYPHLVHDFSQLLILYTDDTILLASLKYSLTRKDSLVNFINKATCHNQLHAEIDLHILNTPSKIPSCQFTTISFSYPCLQAGKARTI